MSQTISLVTAPIAEPVTTQELALQLQLQTPSSTTLQANQTRRLQDFIYAARVACENWTECVFVTQTWKLTRDSFPGHNLRYEWNGYPEIQLPRPPFQSVVSFTYIDVSGTPQTLTQDATYGTNPANPEYGYQLERGSETLPGRLLPPFARPWPPTRMVPANVIVVFRCGYGGPIVASVPAESTAMTVSSGILFDADDAPLLPTEQGLPIWLPGGGASNGPLVTNVSAVPTPGAAGATLAAAATAEVTNAQGWAGQPIPHNIKRAILMTAEWYWEQGSIVGDALPAVAKALLGPRNLVA